VRQVLRTHGRRVAAAGATVLAAFLVLFALIAPNQLAGLTPGEFLRIPVEALVATALLLVLPARPRWIVAAVAGVLFGLLALMKLADMGFYLAFDRPFDPMLDWTFFGPAADFVHQSFGGFGEVVAVVLAVVLVLAVPVLMTLAVLRLTRIAVRHRVPVLRGTAALALVWLVCAQFGTRIVPGVPVASRSAADLAYAHVLQVPAGLRDRRSFGKESAVDAFRDVPGSQLLTGLRGKDVIVTFVESYGRTATQDPQIDALLADGYRRLTAAGFGARSAFLTSPTFGGGSWLAHSTLLSGLWIDNQQRYHDLVASNRFTLTEAFRRAGWRTVGVMPAVTRAWPEGAFYHYNQLYTAENIGYRGPRLSYATMPDQFTMAALQRLERAAPGHAPMMAEIALVSSHAPWVPVPQEMSWDGIGDGSVYKALADAPDAALRDTARIRADYRSTVEYTLNTLISYVQTYGGDNLVLVFLGDHQPSVVVTGTGASHDVPVTIVAHDRAVLDRISGWGWQDGLLPSPNAPVWRMDTFRNRFLSAYGPQPA
jgi:hypothetical protein